jgi:hypothetical protein
VRARLGLSWLFAACTAAPPPAQHDAAPAPTPVPEPSPRLEPPPAPIGPPAPELPLPKIGAQVVTGAPAETTLGVLRHIHPLGGARALLVHGNNLSLTTGPGGHVWTTTLPHSLDDLMVIDGVILGAVAQSFPGAMAFDLATGAPRWQHGPHPNDTVTKDSAYARAVAGPGQVLLWLRNGSSGDRAMVTYRAHDGEVLGVASGSTDRLTVSPRWVAHRYYGAKPGPDEYGHGTMLRPRVALADERMLDGITDTCILEDRLYGVRGADLVRIDLATPALPEQVLPVALPADPVLERCDRHGDEDLLWLPGRVIGVATTDPNLWTLDLGGLRGEFEFDRLEIGVYFGATRQLPSPAALPDLAVLLARREEVKSLLLLDIPARRARELRLAEWFDATLVLAAQQYVLLLKGRDTSVLISIDSATSHVSAAVRIASDSGDLHLTTAGDGSVWLYDAGGWRQPNDAYLDLRTRLDAATLRPLDPSPAFTLHDADAWARQWIDAATPVATPPPRLLPPLPPRPAADRSPSPTAPWDLAPLYAATTRSVLSPESGAEMQLLAWDRQADERGGLAEHALVSVAYPAADGKQWTLVLMRRGNYDTDEPWWEYENSDQPTPPDPAVWEALSTPRGSPRMLHLSHRPTASDLRVMIHYAAPWHPEGNYLGANPDDPTRRAWIVDGNMIDAAWHALTGEAPPLSYPPGIERPD